MLSEPEPAPEARRAPSRLSASDTEGNAGGPDPDMTRVSVVIPTHDRREWLRLTLATVLWQEGVDVEAIVVDDASTDGSAEMVTSLRDPRITVVRHTVARGVSASRNDGGDAATGEWIAFVDDDDLWAPDKLRRQVDAASASGRAWCYTGSVNVEADLRMIGGAPPPPPDVVATLVFRYNVVPGGGSGVVALRDLFRRVGPFDLRLRNTEDWEMWMRFAELGPPACVPDPLVARRIHASNSSLDIAEVLTGIRWIEERHGTRVDRGPLHRWFAESSLRRGRRGQALRHLAIAARHGQARGVVEDVAVIVRRRLRTAARRGPEEPSKHADWIARAEPWLERVRTMATEGTGGS
jgi:glycosyltransferase involved in cell wall biosynthesis